MDTRFAISQYPDAAAVTKKLDYLIQQPMHSINPDVLKKYEEEYFEAKCQKSKAMIDEAKQIIPGGVQHNLAFNYPFPLFSQRLTVQSFTISTATSTMTSFRQAVPQFSVQIPRLYATRLSTFLTLAVLQQVFSTSLNTSLQRRSPTLFPQLTCSVCSVQVQRLVW